VTSERQSENCAQIRLLQSQKRCHALELNLVYSHGNIPLLFSTRVYIFRGEIAMVLNMKLARIAAASLIFSALAFCSGCGDGGGSELNYWEIFGKGQYDSPATGLYELYTTVDGKEIIHGFVIYDVWRDENGHCNTSGDGRQGSPIYLGIRYEGKLPATNGEAENRRKSRWERVIGPHPDFPEQGNDFSFPFNSNVLSKDSSYELLIYKFVVNADESLSGYLQVREEWPPKTRYDLDSSKSKRLKKLKSVHSCTRTPR